MIGGPIISIEEATGLITPPNWARFLMLRGCTPLLQDRTCTVPATLLEATRVAAHVLVRVNARTPADVGREAGRPQVHHLEARHAAACIVALSKFIRIE